MVFMIEHDFLHDINFKIFELLNTGICFNKANHIQEFSNLNIKNLRYFSDGQDILYIFISQIYN
jgi:hypothetical protein